MFVLLPALDSNLSALVSAIAETGGDEWAERLETRELYLHLPRFELADEVDLEDALSKMGMAIAFDRARADFSSMFAEPPPLPVCIDRVKHKTWVVVNEEGTEAAAVTEISMDLSDDGDPPSLVVDRPFLFLIRDNGSGAILFTGTVTDPSNGAATARKLARAQSSQVRTEDDTPNRDGIIEKFRDLLVTRVFRPAAGARADEVRFERSEKEFSISYRVGEDVTRAMHPPVTMWSEIITAMRRTANLPDEPSGEDEIGSLSLTGSDGDKITYRTYESSDDPHPHDGQTIVLIRID